MNVSPLTLEQAQRDVREHAKALYDAEQALENTRGCSILVHPALVVPGCERCEEWQAAWLRVETAEHALEAAQRRLEAVESQVPSPQWIGGER